MLSPIDFVQMQTSNPTPLKQPDYEQLSTEIVNFLMSNNYNYSQGFMLSHNLEHVFKEVEKRLEAQFLADMRNSNQPITVK